MTPEWRERYKRIRKTGWKRFYETLYEEWGTVDIPDCTCNFSWEEMDAAASPWHRKGCPQDEERGPFTPAFRRASVRILVGPFHSFWFSLPWLPPQDLGDAF